MQILKTDRLRLRWFSEADVPFIRRLLNEPSWIHNIGDRQIHSDEAALDYIRTRLLANYWRHGFGFWAVEREADGALIGMCGLTQRDSLPEPDVGYALLPAYWGQGYAREAAAACLRYAHEVLGLRTVLAITAPHNRASMALLADIGLRPGVPPVLNSDDGESRFFAWQAPPPPSLPAGGDAAAIDALVQRTFSAFTNRGGAVPTLAAIPHWCLPDMTLHRRDGEGVVSLDLQGFLAPRAALLGSGRLLDFEEHETEQRTDIAGGLAQRWSCYRQAGQLDGEPFVAEGRKAFQFVLTPRGWRIAALVWEDAQTRRASAAARPV